jgi:hypothetical protein
MPSMMLVAYIVVACCLLGLVASETSISNRGLDEPIPEAARTETAIRHDHRVGWRPMDALYHFLACYGRASEGHLAMSGRLVSASPKSF